MVVANTPKIPVTSVSAALGRKLRKMMRSEPLLSECIGLVVEVEDPRKELGVKKRTEALARIRRFCTLAETQGFTLRALEFDYKQPRLLLDDEKPEVPLLLLSARVRERGRFSDTHEEAIVDIRCIYTSVYPDGYSADNRENEIYADYCANLAKIEIDSLPPNMRALSAAQLAARVRKDFDSGSTSGGQIRL